MNQYFKIEESGSTVKTELIAGITTFLATMYIIIVNPAIISTIPGMSFNAVLTATVLVSAFSSIAMGIYAKNPIVLAPGMGINAFFTYSVVLGMKIPWETALGIVFWSGVIFLLLSVLNIRASIVKSIPKQLRAESFERFPILARVRRIQSRSGDAVRPRGVLGRADPRKACARFQAIPVSRVPQGGSRIRERIGACGGILMPWRVWWLRPRSPHVWASRVSQSDCDRHPLGGGRTMDDDSTPISHALAWAVLSAIMIGIVAMLAGGALAVFVVVAIVGYAWQAST